MSCALACRHVLLAEMSGMLNLSLILCNYSAVCLQVCLNGGVCYNHSGYSVSRFWDRNLGNLEERYTEITPIPDKVKITTLHAMQLESSLSYRGTRGSRGKQCVLYKVLWWRCWTNFPYPHQLNCGCLTECICSMLALLSHGFLSSYITASERDLSTCKIFFSERIITCTQVCWVVVEYFMSFVIRSNMYYAVIFVKTTFIIVHRNPVQTGQVKFVRCYSRKM